MVDQRMLFTVVTLVFLIPAYITCPPQEEVYDDDNSDIFDDDDDQPEKLIDNHRNDIGHENKSPQSEQVINDKKVSKWTYKVAEGCKSAECRYKTCALSPQDEYSCTATQYRDCSNKSREKILTCANGMVFDGVGGSCSYKAKCESEPRRRKG